MPDFRRLPEWDQQAHRHTQLADPVLTVRQLGRFEYATRRDLTRVDNALVFVNGKGGHDTFMPPRRPSRAEIAAGRYKAVYEVDTGIHQLQVELTLPSDNDAFEFDATADITWQVTAPAAFVTSGERDVPALLARRLRHLIRPVARLHSIENSPAAERAVQEALDAADALGAAAIGLRVTCAVLLRLDNAAIAHHRELRAMHYADEQLAPAHELRMREDRLQAERALEQGRQQHELIMQQQDLAHEHAMVQGKQQVELQQIEAEKIRFYQYYLQQEGVAAWAFHLSQHPEDSRLVMESLRQDQLILIKSQMELATEIIKGDAAEEYELEEPKRVALRTLHDFLNQRLPGVAKGPALARTQETEPQVPHMPPGPAPYGNPPSYGAPPAWPASAAHDGDAPSLDKADHSTDGHKDAPPAPH